MSPIRTTVVDVDLDAVAANVRALGAGGAQVIAVVKADAYGHGAEMVAETALEAGAVMVAVFTVEEAVLLRRTLREGPILVLGGASDAAEAEAAVASSLAVTVWDESRARALAAAARAAGRTVPVHLKVDTGLTRLGVLPGEALERWNDIAAIPGLELDGIFTHFATADDAGDTFAAEQLRRFAAVVGTLPSKPRLVHASASAGLAALGLVPPCNAVRPGLAVYGLYTATHLPTPHLRPALRWSSRIHRVVKVPAGTGVGYGHDYRTHRSGRIATVPVGYGDGLPRSARRADVLVRGRRVQVANRVAMDLFMLDVTDVPDAREGDEVVLIGEQDGEHLPAEDLAASCGTINYEIVTNIRQRVPRRYFRGGDLVATRTMADGLVRL
ncbi:MAG: alanine racemase [Candidatus Limnocylindria bacterium]